MVKKRYIGDPAGKTFDKRRERSLSKSGRTIANAQEYSSRPGKAVPILSGSCLLSLDY
jgi:hypothetical protein